MVPPGARRRGRLGAQRTPGQKILTVDVGGTRVKLKICGASERRDVDSGPRMGPAEMAEAVRRLSAGWDYDVVSLGYPGVVVHGRPASEPKNLAPGWVAFDYAAAFERPVKILNDAALQAVGGYRGGKMLFLGLGTGLGSALIADALIQPLELAHLPYRKGRTFEDYVGKAGRARLGLRKWQKHVGLVVELLRAALQADEVLLGGGRAEELEWLPDRARLGGNEHAFAGGALLFGDTPFAAQVPEFRRAARRRRARAARRRSARRD
jgi:polyphosphate glucokinase